MLGRLKALFRPGAPGHPVFGFLLAFANAETRVRYEGYPHEIQRRMKSDGRGVRAVAEHLETEIKATEVRGVPASSSGAPRRRWQRSWPRSKAAGSTTRCVDEGQGYDSLQP